MKKSQIISLIVNIIIIIISGILYFGINKLNFLSLIILVISSIILISWPLSMLLYTYPKLRFLFYLPIALFPYIYIVWILMGYYRHVDLVIFVLNQAVYFPLIWICALATLFRTILRTSGINVNDIILV